MEIETIRTLVDLGVLVSAALLALELGADALLLLPPSTASSWTMGTIVRQPCEPALPRKRLTT